MKQAFASESTNQCYIARQDSTESNARTYPRKFPIAIAKARGSWVEDVEGVKYLDFLCGAGTLALGHNDVEVNAAMIEMLTSDAPLHTLDLMTPVKHRFVEKVMSLLPDKMQGRSKIQFCSPAGSDAFDAALKLCKTATGRGSVVTFQGGYHGMGHGALACTGNLNAKEKVANLMPGVHFFPYPHPYRCPFGLGGEAGVDAACAFFERSLKDPEAGITKPAAVVIEAIQGEGGVVPAPVKFLQTLRRVTSELGIPLVLDEIQCGIGRSGRFFGFEEAGITPDVILMSKAVGGSLPLAIVVYDESLDKWTAGAHAGTFRGNQLAMRAGTVLLERVSQSEFLAEVEAKGNYLKERFLALKEKVSIIGDVRGRGLMLGVEFVDPALPPDAIGAYPASGEIAAAVQQKCFSRHLIMERGGRGGSVMRCLCALNITQKDLETGADIFEEAVIEADKEAAARA